MAITDEITRLQTAKSNLKASINAKTDSSHKINNETLDAFYTFVDSITTGGGGGLPGGISKIDFGDISVTSAFTTSAKTISHSLGVTPDLVIVYATANVATNYSMLWAMRASFMGYRSSAYTSYMCYHGNSTTTTSLTNSNSTSYGVSNMTATSFKLASAGSSYYWRAGTYKYLAIKFS